MKHSPIPEFLCYQVDDEDGFVHWEPLPDDLDRLFRASPKLADALMNIEEYWNRDQNRGAMADALWHIIETARTARKLLEEKP